MDKRLIKEARGIAESTIPYTHAVINEIDKKLEFFFKKIFGNSKYLESVKDLRKDGYLPMPDYTVELNIPYRNLARYIDDEIFEDFPLVDLNVDLKFAYVDSELTSSTELNPAEEAEEVRGTGDRFGISGGAWPIFSGNKQSTASQRTNPELYPISRSRKDSVDKTLRGELEFDFHFYSGFNPKDDYDNFHRELRSVVFHEMMHLYEGYKDKSQDIYTLDAISTKKPKTKTPTSKSYLTKTKFIGIPNEMKEDLEFLLNVYYMSLPVEIRAITHEMYPYVLDMSVDEFFKMYQGKRVKGLMEFDAEEFYDNLKESAKKYFERKGEFNQEVLDGFLEQIRLRILKTYRTKATNNNEVVDEKFLSQKSLKSLIKYMGKQIERGGKKLFRNVGRLYSLKSELN